MATYKKVYAWQDSKLTPEIDTSDAHLRNGKPEPNDPLAKSSQKAINSLYEEKIEKPKQEEKDEPYTNAKDNDTLDQKIFSMQTSFEMSLIGNQIPSLPGGGGGPNKIDKDIEPEKT